MSSWIIEQEPEVIVALAVFGLGASFILFTFLIGFFGR